MKIYFYIGIGGVIGSLARYLLTTIFISDKYPLSIFFINIIGAFLLGWFTSAVIAKKILPAEINTAIGTGIIGSFTTLSTFSMDFYQLIIHHQYLWAITYFLTSNMIGLLAGYIGLSFGEKKWKRDQNHV